MMRSNLNINRAINGIICIFLLFLFACTSQPDDKTKTADVIIYGGTSAAVSTAVQVKRMGKSVLIVCPDKHLGGMTSSGLGFTDTGDKSVIGGIAREFYQRLYKYYQDPATGSGKSRKSMETLGKELPRWTEKTKPCGFLSRTLQKAYLRIS